VCNCNCEQWQGLFDSLKCVVISSKLGTWLNEAIEVVKASTQKQPESYFIGSLQDLNIKTDVMESDEE